MRTDVLLDDNHDLIDEDDEWAEGDSDQTDIELLLLLNKGELHQFPFVGFGIEKRLKAVADANRFKREIQVELENDGFTNAQIQLGKNIEDFKITI